MEFSLLGARAVAFRARVSPAELARVAVKLWGQRTGHVAHDSWSATMFDEANSVPGLLPELS